MGAKSSRTFLLKCFSRPIVVIKRKKSLLSSFRKRFVGNYYRICQQFSHSLSFTTHLSKIRRNNLLKLHKYGEKHAKTNPNLPLKRNLSLYLSLLPLNDHHYFYLTHKYLGPMPQNYFSSGLAQMNFFV